MDISSDVYFAVVPFIGRPVLKLLVVVPPPTKICHVPSGRMSEKAPVVTVDSVVP